ncbi:hypothetical protein JCM8208_005838 [Rhodotorula glutinis]
MPPTDKSTPSARASGEDLLLSQVDELYRLMANPRVSGLKGPQLDEARRRAQVSPTSSKALGVARGLWVKRWDKLMPAERARILVVVLRAYCKSRRQPTAFDWHQLSYLSVLGDVGAKDSFDEADLNLHGPVETLKDDAPWLEIRKHVDGIAHACSRGRSNALYRMRLWEIGFLGEGGITRLKLRRLEVAEREAVASEVGVILKHVHEHLSSPSSAPIDTILPSADAVFIRVDNATESPSRRFDGLCGFLDNLVILYKATPGHDGAVAQLSRTRGMLERRTHLPREDDVVDVRTAEASFAELDVAQQVSAVEQARTLVFEACLQHRETGQLPAVEPLIQKLLEPLHDPRAVAPLKRWRLCIDSLSAVVRLYEDAYKAHEHVAKSLSHELAVLDTYPAAELFVELPEEKQVAAVQRCRSMVAVLGSSKNGLLPPVADVVANFLQVLPHPASDPVYRNAAPTRSFHSLRHVHSPDARRSPRRSSSRAEWDPYFPSARGGW